MYNNTSIISSTASKLLILLFSLSTSALAGIQPIKTTWLKSTGGAGVAAILLDETTILNPAPIAFFNNSAAYYSYTKSKITPAESTNNPETNNTKGMNFILSDAQQNTKGSFNYGFQEHNEDKRELYAFATGGKIGKKSALGFTYRYIKDDIGGIKDEYHQTAIGALHVINPYTSFGIVLDNPVETDKKDTLALTGIKLSYQDLATFMADIGGNYYEGLSDTFTYRAGIQLKVFADFLLRLGMYKDNARDERGSGFGLSWVSPRLIASFAINNVEVNENKILNQEEEKIKETSFSASMHF